MLTFLRKYQRIFFVLITGVIIVSFSFFGAYSGMTNPAGRDSDAFTAVNGKAITHSELAQMRLFLSSDGTDKLYYGGLPGPNFLNDGVVRRDILQTGLGEVLVTEYFDLIQPDLRHRYDRERRFTGYQHPHAPHLSAENIWGYFAPAVRGGLDALRDVKDPLSADAFALRTHLYLAEQNFPQQALKEVLQIQEKQYEWVQPDTLLERRDLALFGYHSLEDWFGQRFLTLVAEFVFNASLIAEEQGYKVSKAEAWADLQHNAEVNFQQAHFSPNVIASNSGEYLDNQLRLMGLDKATAIKLWQRVLLFRRYFDDVGNAALLDKLAFEKFQGYANETIVADQYTFPIHLDTYRDLQQFEAYLAAIGDQQMTGNTLPLQTLLDNNPELVQKHYRVEMVSVQKEAIRQQIPLREVWNWQLDPQHWPQLVATTPLLAATAPDKRDDRFEALQRLNKGDRAKLDRLAQEAILGHYNSSIPEALNEAEPAHMSLRLTFDPDHQPLPGITEPQRLMTLLDTHDQIDEYSDDGEHIYRFRLLERPDHPTLMTYNEACESGAIKKTDREFYRNFYKQVRASDPERYQYDDHTWRRLSEVRDEMADKILADQLNSQTGEEAAHTRFAAHLATALEAIQAGDTTPLRTGDQTPTNQWQLVKTSKTYTRSDDTAAYDLAIGDFSPLRQITGTPPYFYQVIAREPGSLSNERRVDLARDALSAEAQRALMRDVVTQIHTRNGISLAWLDQDT